MPRSLAVSLLLVLASFAASGPVGAEKRPMRAMDVFQLEHASDPRVSPDGRRVIYARRSMDVMKDRKRSRLWIVDVDGARHLPLTEGERDESGARWSPDGERIAFVAESEGRTQVWVRYLEGNRAIPVTQLEHSPSGLSWSPDGRWLAFSMLVPDEPESWVEMPKPPEGAEWAEKPRVVERMIYRRDGRGFVEDGHRQIFIVPSEGGTPRQLTSGPHDHGGTPSWTPDGEALVFSANRREDSDHVPNDSAVWKVAVADGTLTQLTDRFGPDSEPVVSPDGRLIAYTGYDDTFQGHATRQLSIMNADGSDPRVLTSDLDRTLSSPQWSSDGEAIYFSYSDEGNGKVGRVALSGEITTVAHGVGGTSLGRPYGSGSFSVGPRGVVAYTWTDPHHPADIAVVSARHSEPRRLTTLNEDLLAQVRLGEVEELRWKSSHDGRKIQGWLVTPPDFDPAVKHPLILEIHGGPFADYGDRFSAEVQLYAAAGHVVLYANPRGSTSYGQEFANLIHHAYPGDDYHDLMSGVDAVLARGFVDPERLFVTGGSGGGVLTAWIVGKTDRFRAAVVAKPVINWTSFVLTSDAYNFFHQYWFSAPPWEDPEEYRRRSPLFLVGNVTTPTMLLTGEDDLRTPIAESEQYYQALQLRKVPSALVRIPGASHGIASRPSRLIAKVAHVLGWFAKHDVSEEDEGDDDEADDAAD